MDPPQDAQPELSELLGPDYLRQSCAEIPGIPQNWPESWSILRETLQGLEDSGMTPHAAVLGLLHVRMIREQDLAMDASALNHLEEHLETNYVPSASERTQIQEFCAKSSEKLFRLFAEIEIDRCRLITSNGRSVALNDRIYPYYALISSMRALPPEILQEIFMACLPAGHDAVMHTSEPPLLLGRVCSAWRTISLSTPMLWSSLHVVVPPHYIRPLDGVEPPANAIVAQRCEGLRTWLQRSGDCPLSISLFNESTMNMITQDFLGIILSYSRRLRSITLIRVADESLSPLQTLQPEDVPLLEAINIVDDGWGAVESEYLAFCAVPPNLRALSLKCNSGQRLPMCSWTQITTLSLECRVAFFTLNLGKVMELVEQCFNLQSCRLAFPSERGSMLGLSAAPSPVTLPHLHTLSLTAASAINLPFNLARIMGSFVTPALKTLAIHNLQNPRRRRGSADGPVSSESDVMLAIDELVERSSCALSALRVDEAMGDVESLLRCLRRLPGLVKLDLAPLNPLSSPSVELMPILDALIAASSSTEPPLCPKLTHLRLKHCDTSDAYHPVLQTLIESRCHNQQSPFSEQTDTPRLRMLNIILHLPSDLNALDLWRFWPTHVSITPPFERPQGSAASTRWGGIVSDQTGMDISWG
ncbi:hypothetical protein DFH09DRAFT_473602 [Mycena vulgaris]|nr:hypothetical protein DFH09DRAFT_473602 [Mycena vulgaris]